MISRKSDQSGRGLPPRLISEMNRPVRPSRRYHMSPRFCLHSWARAAFEVPRKPDREVRPPRATFFRNLRLELDTLFVPVIGRSPSLFCLAFQEAELSQKTADQGFSGLIQRQQGRTGGAAGIPQEVEGVFDRGDAQGLGQGLIERRE